MQINLNNLSFCVQVEDPVGDGNVCWQRNWTSDTFDATKCAVIVVDATGLHDVPRVMDTIRDFVSPALHAARAAGMKILHTPSQPQPANPTDVISPLVYSPGDYLLWAEVVNDVPAQGARITRWLQDVGAQDVFYVGFLANQCFLTRPAGLMNMQHYVNGLSPLPRFVVLEDCTSSIEEVGAVGFPAKDAFMNLARIYPRTYTINNASFLAAI